MPDKPTKFLSIKEFREGGYLQELNRRFLHPLGLALEVRMDEYGTEKLGGIWDYRDDPEGILFGPGVIDQQKIVKVADEWAEKALVRRVDYGFVIQPK